MGLRCKPITILSDVIVLSMVTNSAFYIANTSLPMAKGALAIITGVKAQLKGVLL